MRPVLRASRPPTSPCTLTCLKIGQSQLTARERPPAWDDRAGFGRLFSHDATASGEMERSLPRAVDLPGKVAMQRVKHPPVRNKINLAEPAQVRAWTCLLYTSDAADDL